MLPIKVMELELEGSIREQGASWVFRARTCRWYYRASLARPRSFGSRATGPQACWPESKGVAVFGKSMQGRRGEVCLDEVEGRLACT